MSKVTKIVSGGQITTSHSLLKVHAAKDFDLFYYHDSRYTLYIIKEKVLKFKHNRSPKYRKSITC